MNNKRLIAIVGGIGAGKSVVSHIVASMGYRVYDTDFYAKKLMNSSQRIKSRLVENFSEEVLSDGKVSKQFLSRIVFKNQNKLEILNSIVHGEVKNHLEQWYAGAPDGIMFVETALLYQSGLDAMVDEVWQVDAPVQLRIERVMKRNGLTRSEVERRIQSQSFNPGRVHPNVRLITNDGCAPLLPQINALIDELRL